MPGQPLPGMSSLLLGHSTLQKQPEKLAHSLRVQFTMMGAPWQQEFEGTCHIPAAVFRKQRAMDAIAWFMVSFLWASSAHI